MIRSAVRPALHITIHHQTYGILMKVCAPVMSMAARQLRPSSSTAMNPSYYVDDEAAKEEFFRNFRSSDHFRENVVYSLSFASNGLENDLASDNTFVLFDDRMKRQLLQSYSTLQSPSSYTAQVLRSRLPPELNLESLEPLAAGDRLMTSPFPRLDEDEQKSDTDYSLRLPKTIIDISPKTLDSDARAIVVTDTQNPFRITNVNSAWESLCGYSRSECKGRTLGSLLQGPETDMGAVTALVSQLLLGEEAGTILTNYKKDGRKFRNIVRVGPVVDEMGKTVRFVGVLREVKPEIGKDGGEGFESERDVMQLPFMS